MDLSVIAQVIGIVAMCAIIVSFQFKERWQVILCQLAGALLFSVNMFMLGAVIGGLLNAVATVRALVYLKADKMKIDPRVLQGIFISLYVISYVLTFTVFGKELSAKNIIIELLPVIGMIAVTFGFAGKSAKEIRLYSFINSPCWLIYNCFNFTIGGILCEVFSLVSNISAFLRYDIKKKPASTSENNK